MSQKKYLSEINTFTWFKTESDDIYLKLKASNPVEKIPALRLDSGNSPLQPTYLLPTAQVTPIKIHIELVAD